MSPSAPMFWPDWIAAALQWSALNHIGDLAGLLGIAISIAGFIVTLIKLAKSQKAAEAAQEAAETTRRSISFIGAVADLSEGLAIMAEIKRFNRSAQLHLLPDRYSALRRILIATRSGATPSPSSLSEEQRTIIQSALSNLARAEEAVERSLARGDSANFDFPRHNKILSKDIDQLQGLIVNLQMQAGERP